MAPDPQLEDFLTTALVVLVMIAAGVWLEARRLEIARTPVAAKRVRARLGAAMPIEVEQRHP